MTALWIAACLASLATGMLIAYAHTARHVRALRPAEAWRPTGAVAPTPNQELLADVWQEAA